MEHQERGAGIEIKEHAIATHSTNMIFFYLYMEDCNTYYLKKFEMTGLEFFFPPKRPCFYSSVINQHIWQTFVSEHANCLENSNC